MVEKMYSRAAEKFGLLWQAASDAMLFQWRRMATDRRRVKSIYHSMYSSLIRSGGYRYSVSDDGRDV